MTNIPFSTHAKSNSPAWGKLGLIAGRSCEQALADHCRDVAVVFVALCRLPGIRSRLARLAAVLSFADVWIERLGWLVFLHDFGKVNWGFQHRRDPGAPVIGHIAPIAGLPEEGDFILLPDGLDGWAEDPALLADLFDAILSHHGRPWPKAVGQDPRYTKYWAPWGDYAPLAELKTLCMAAGRRFPAAVRAGEPPLPLTSPLVHFVAGLTMLSDWIASSDWQNSPKEEDLDEWALGHLARIGLDPAPWRARPSPAVSFEDAFEFAPRPAQVAFFSAEGSLALLESETGSGKTEAALWRFFLRFQRAAVDGLYFALPTRTAAVQLHGRIVRMVKRIWPGNPPPVVLAVPGYLDDTDAGALPAAADSIDAAEGDARSPAVWASEHPKRYFAGLVSVGTIDQALFAALRTKHAHMRGAALARLMLVVDEVHASDSYMTAILESLLRDHLAAGGEAALLSATLGSTARSRYLAIPKQRNLADVAPMGLDAAIGQPYPAVSTDAGLQAAPHGGREKRVHIELQPWIDEPAAIAGQVLAAARAGAKVLVVRNTVKGAVAVAMALLDKAGADAPSTGLPRCTTAGLPARIAGCSIRRSRQPLAGRARREA